MRLSERLLPDTRNLFTEEEQTLNSQRKLSTESVLDDAPRKLHGLQP